MENEEILSLNSKSTSLGGGGGAEGAEVGRTESEESVLDSWETENNGGGAVAQLERSLEQLKQQKKKKEEEAKILQEKAETMVSLGTEGGLAETNPDMVPPPTVLKILRRPRSSGNLEQNTPALRHPQDHNTDKDDDLSDLAGRIQKILPAVPASAVNGVAKKTTLKPLEEREKAYAEARQRIFGDRGSFEEVPSDTEDFPLPVELLAAVGRKEPTLSEEGAQKGSLKESSSGNTPGILKISKKDTILEPSQEAKSSANPETEKTPAPQAAKPKFQVGPSATSNSNSGGGKKSRHRKKSNQQNQQQQGFRQIPTQKIRLPVAQGSSSPLPPVSVMSMPDMTRPPPVFPPPQIVPRQPGQASVPGTYQRFPQASPGGYGGGARYPPVSAARGPQVPYPTHNPNEVPYGCPPPAFYSPNLSSRPPSHTMSMPEQRMHQEAAPHMAPHPHPPHPHHTLPSYPQYSLSGGGGGQWSAGANQQPVGPDQNQMYRQQNPVRILQTNQTRGQMGRGY